LTLDRWKSVLLVWWVQMWYFCFQPPCLCEMQSWWTDVFRMCGSHCEVWRRRCDCGGALLVTLIYLEFKAHLTCMATTAFCSDIPSHLVCFSGTIICFSIGQWPNTPPGCVRAIWPRRRVMEGCIRWPGLHNHLTNPNEIVWDELDNKCSAYVGTPSRLLEKHTRWSWLRECNECAKLSSRQRVATLKNLTYKIYFDLINTFWLLDVFHGFEGF
jgi:hypothetical protein